MSFPELLLVKMGDSIWLNPHGELRWFVLKWLVMNLESNVLTTFLGRAWRAVVKAFTPAADAPGSQQYGGDTTMFGGVTEQPRDRTARDRARNDFWVATESTDFADVDAERDAGRRR